MDEIRNLWVRALNEAWNPLSISFEEDAEDWKSLSELQRKYLADLFFHQLFGEYEVLINVSRLAFISKDLDVRFFLLTHARDNTVHANIFERFLISVGESIMDFRGRISNPYLELGSKKPGELLKELESSFDEKKLAQFLTIYYLALDGILYNTSYIALEELLFSRGLFKNLYTAYKKINVDEKRQTLFGAYYIKHLSLSNREILDTVRQTLNECTPLVLSVIGYFAPLAESFNRKIEEFAALSQGVIDEELTIIGIK